jgi:hypothetical protein
MKVNHAALVDISFLKSTLGLQDRISAPMSEQQNNFIHTL